MTLNKLIPSVNVLGVRVDDFSLQELLEKIENIIRSSHRAIVANVNIYALNIAFETEWFHKFLNDSEIVFCDGYGVIWGTRLTGKRLRYRHTYAEFCYDLCMFAEEKEFTVFFLGGRPGVVQIAADRLLEKFPALKIVGVEHGYFNKTRDHAENQRIVARINAAQPDILVLGFGMPLQERWLHENFPDINARTAFTGGAVFDYISGVTPRAPRWMTDHGFEWLGRFLIEPKRLWKRYLLGNPIFFWRILVHDVLGFRLPGSLSRR